MSIDSQVFYFRISDWCQLAIKWIKKANLLISLSLIVCLSQRISWRKSGSSIWTIFRYRCKFLKGLFYNKSWNFFVKLVVTFLLYLHKARHFKIVTLITSLLYYGKVMKIVLSFINNYFFNYLLITYPWFYSISLDNLNLNGDDINQILYFFYQPILTLF